MQSGSYEYHLVGASSPNHDPQAANISRKGEHHHFFLSVKPNPKGKEYLKPSLGGGKM